MPDFIGRIAVFLALAVFIFMGVRIVLAVLEVVAPGYILPGFAIGVAATGLLIAAGIPGGSLPVLLLVAAVILLSSWLVLRKVFGLWKGQVKI